MPYKEKLEMVFPQDDHRNVMVFGDNMRKTSILNAIRWAFYGESVDTATDSLSGDCKQRLLWQMIVDQKQVI